MDVHTIDSDSDSDKEEYDEEENKSEKEATEEQDIDEDLKDTQTVYKENCWPPNPETPKGYTFKGKSKMMTYSLGKIKQILKKGTEKEINSVKFIVLDVKLVGGATQTVIQMIDKDGRGNAIADLWGPNKRKECTILLKKSKEYDERFVKVLAKQIIQPFLDCIISGKSLDTLLKTSKKSREQNKCDVCNKVFKSPKYLKVHRSKIHTVSKNNCEQCEYSDQNKIKLREHMKTIHGDASGDPTMDVEATSNEENTNITIVDTPSTKKRALKSLEEISWEEKRIDDLLMDTESTTQNAEKDASNEIEEDKDTLLQRSNSWDEKIKRKELERAEKEEMYKKQKEKKDEERIKRTKSSRRKRKGKAGSNEEKNPKIINIELPDSLKHVPNELKQFTNEDDLILKIVGDGSCGIRASAAHIFENQKYGPRFRSLINTHIMDRWDFYSNKVSFPYSRQVGIEGRVVEFNVPEEYLEFLRHDKDAAYLWTDSEELVAVSNLYQIEIKIITVKGPDYKNPVMNMIKPDPELKEFCILPAGTVPDMILLHNNDSHYDLILPRKSRLVQGLLSNREENKTKPERDEIESLRDENKKLSMLVIELKNQIENLKAEKDTPNNDNTNKVDIEEAQVLNKGKLSGFSREGPHSKPLAKQIFECKSCNRIFNKNEELLIHVKEHTNDGDWNCNECPYQTNSEYDLEKHIKIAHTKQSLPCHFCGKIFHTKKDLDKHKITHKSFRPCRNLPECSYAENCRFNHNTVYSNQYLCYNCGKENETLGDLMKHRNTMHTTNKCKKLAENKCKFTSESCWFNHEEETKENEHISSSQKEFLDSSKPSLINETHPSVFRQTQANLAPPPTQEIWSKMLSMLENLTQMLNHLKQTNQSQ